jgi:hypothetical protein
MYRHRFSLKAAPPAPRPAGIVILDARRQARLEPPVPIPDRAGPGCEDSGHRARAEDHRRVRAGWARGRGHAPQGGSAGARP